MEIWASIDILGGKVVRLIKGDPSNIIVYSDDPIKTAIEIQSLDVNGLHIVDLNAALNKGNNYHLIKKISKSVCIPIQVGGGIRDLQKMKNVLKYSDRIVISTILFENKIIEEELEKIGIGKIVVALDHSDGIIKISGWKEKLELKLENVLEKFVQMGFNNFIITNIEKDGTLKGFDERIFQKIRKDYLQYIYAAGGISSKEDLLRIKSLGLKGAIIGRAIYENKIGKKDIEDIKRNGDL